jgi:hypothetical protein
MQAVTLMVVFVLTAAVVQFLGFLASQLVDRLWPAAGLLTFLVCFLAAYAIAWPIAVRIAEWLIGRAGYVVDTEQSGGIQRRDSLASYNADRRAAATRASTP